MLLLALLASLSVTEVLDRHETLTGETVEVRGWLAQCQPLSCSIVGVAPNRRRKTVPIWDGSPVGISLGGADPRVERALRALSGVEVVLTARVGADCWPLRDDPESFVLCTDRASQLIPLAVRKAERK